MRKLIVYCIVFVLLCSFSLSLGVARPFISANTALAGDSQDYIMKFQLQNGESVSKNMLFSISTQSPGMISETNSFVNNSAFQKMYVLQPRSMTPIEIHFKGTNGVYRVDYSYSEAASGNGSVKFDTKTSDYFLVKAGDGDYSYALGIPVVYSGFSLITSAIDPKSVTDLQISKLDGTMSIDFRGDNIDLTGFKEQYISFGTRTVTINSAAFPNLNKPAKITMYQVQSPYKIYKDGVECPNNICSVISYSSSRLVFSVNGFSTYEVKYVPVVNNTPIINNTPVIPTPSSNPSSGGGGSSGGIIPSRNITPVNPIRPIIPNVPIPQREGGIVPETSQLSQSSTGQGLNSSLLLDKEISGSKLTPNSVEIIPKDKKKIFAFVVAAFGLGFLTLAIFLYGKGGEL